MDRKQLAQRMWGRVEHCRRLAIQTTDPKTAEALLEMAKEGEADIKRMLAEDRRDGPAR